MKTISEKIKALRLSKRLTQNGLAEALSVSVQTVSKWENGISSPDISLLPCIARFFGISIDELFGYRLEALNQKERLIRFLYDNGMLRFGEFKLKSGRISPYLIQGVHYHNSSQIAKLGEFYADALRDNCLENSCLVSAGAREAPLAVSAAIALYNKYGCDTPCCTETKLLSEKALNVNTVIITDTFTSGKTLCEALQRIKNAAGKYPTDAIVCVDRNERTDNTFLTARHETEKAFGLKIHSMVNAQDIINSIERSVIPAIAYLDALRKYTEEYKGE